MVGTVETESVSPSLKRERPIRCAPRGENSSSSEDVSSQLRLGLSSQTSLGRSSIAVEFSFVAMPTDNTLEFGTNAILRDKTRIP